MADPNAFTVTIGGQPLPADLQPLLVSAHVESSLRMPGAFSLRFRDPQRIVVAKASAELGADVTISAPGTNGRSEKLITGQITVLEGEFDVAGSYTVIRGHDQLHLLQRGSRTQAWVQVTVADVVRKVAGLHGITVGKVEATTVVHPQLLQAGVSDFEFVSELADRVGLDLTFVDGKLNLVPPTKASTAPAATAAAQGDPRVLQAGINLLSVRSTVTGSGQVEEVETRGWDETSKQVVKSTAPAKHDGVAIVGLDPGKVAKDVKGGKHVATDVVYTTQAEVEAAAPGTAARFAGILARVEAVAQGHAALGAGVAIRLDGLGAPFDGAYTVTVARHRYDPAGGYTTQLRVTGRQERSLLGLGGGSGGRSSRMSGVVIGEVTDVKDPENRCRVKVKYPWLSDDYASDWVRTVQPGAGKNRGAEVLSEVGDEVLIAFDRGDVGRPFVIGGLYNGTEKPPSGTPALIDSGSGQVNRRSFVSRTGNRIDLLDSTSAQGITLATDKDKLTVQLDAKGTKVTVHSDGTVTVEGSKGVTIDSGTGTLTLQGQQIKLAAKTGVNVDGGSGAVEVKTNAALSLKGMTSTLEGTTQAAVRSNAICTIAGSLVKIN